MPDQNTPAPGLAAAGEQGARKAQWQVVGAVLVGLAVWELLQYGKHVTLEKQRRR